MEGRRAVKKQKAIAEVDRSREGRPAEHRLLLWRPCVKTLVCKINRNRFISKCPFPQRTSRQPQINMMTEKQEGAQSNKKQSKSKGTVNESQNRKCGQKKRQEGLENHHRPPRSMLQSVVAQCIDHKVVGELHGGFRHSVERQN
jgi:hypothetical protein